jgi:hypothetical protein
MSNIENKENDPDINWLEKSISDGHIKYYEYSDFRDWKRFIWKCLFC